MLSAEDLQSAFYAALAQHGFAAVDEPRTPGNVDCLASAHVEVQGFSCSDGRLRVDISVPLNTASPEPVDALCDDLYSRAYSGRVHFLRPREDLFVTPVNLSEVVARTLVLAERGNSLYTAYVQ